MKLRVDSHCMGHGRCYRLMPDLLSSDEEGYVSIRGQTIDVPEALRELALEAEGTCPEGAIEVFDA